MRTFHTCFLGLALILTSPAVRADDAPCFKWKDGDRIVLVGDTLIERDQRYGYLETLLTVRHPEKDLTFRNLGWSGDSVGGLSRAGFDPPEAGYRQLIEQVLAARPTVLIVGYGMADSFDGEAGLPRFVAGLNRFLDAVAPTKARLILLSPIAHARLGSPWPDPSAHNAMLALYSRSIAEVARSRGAWFIDLFGPFHERMTHDRDGSRGPLAITDNGIHLTDAGYRLFGELVLRSLEPSVKDQVPRLELKLDLATSSVGRAKVSRVKASLPDVRFQMTRDVLAEVGDGSQDSPFDTSCLVAVKGLPAGRYELRSGNRAVALATAEEWGRGVRVSGGPDLDQVERLRAVINAKNRLFFYRWRPQNITYLFGFRKHEQGQNAVEVPRFDPLVAEQEREIARLCKPMPHDYELVRIVDPPR